MSKPLFASLIPTADALGFNAVENGAVVDIGAYDVPAGVIVAGTFVATLKLEVSMDGSNWAQFGADITAPTTVKIDIPVKQVRVRCTAYTSGAAFAYLGAKNSTTSDE